MKITVNTKEFKNAMEKIFRFTISKQRIFTLENILLRVTGNDLYLSASNLEQSAKAKIYAESTADMSFGFSDTKSLLKAMRFFTEDNITMEYTPSEKRQ